MDQRTDQQLSNTPEPMNTHTEGNKVMSYGTHVATIDHEARTVIAHGKWSATTTKHVNAAARALGYTVTKDPKGQANSTKVSRDTFAAQRQGGVKEDPDASAEDAPILSALRMFAALAGMNPNPEQAQTQQERLLFATPGISKPEGWDALPMQERKRRTAQALQAAK
jgi:hypothetical protein